MAVKILKKENNIKKVNGESHINENLDPYWSCLTGMEQKKWYANEIYIRKYVGIKTLSDSALEKLRTAKRGEGEKYIFNTTNFDILSNMRYADLFLYEQINKRKRDDHANSELIASLLYLGEPLARSDQVEKISLAS